MMLSRRRSTLILYLQAEPVTLRITGPPRLDLEPGTR